jgi:hypothetical protein
MEAGFQQLFIEQWDRYFPGASLPITFYYSDNNEGLPRTAGGHCVIHELERVREGSSIALNDSSIGCLGGKNFLGFATGMRPNFKYFLSCGIPGKMEGERYKATPELVEEQMIGQQPLPAPAKYILFKRWDKLSASDQPLVVIFFARPDVLSGLFTLANYDESDSQAVIAPMGSGCSSIVQNPLRQMQSDHPRCILGMFDVSARPWVPADELTLAIPWPKFVRMVENMDESFLITGSWQKIRSRLQTA